MADETIHAFLGRRERELKHRIAALRGQLDPMERELVEVQKAMALLAVSVGVNRQNPARARTATLSANQQIPPFTSTASLAGAAAVGFAGEIQGRPKAVPTELAQRFAGMTIKQLVIQALSDHFLAGATPTQIREFIHDAYGREIDANSLRPQLARMKADGSIEQNPNNDTWMLSKTEMRRMRWYGVEAPPGTFIPEGAPEVTDGD